MTRMDRLTASLICAAALCAGVSSPALSAVVEVDATTHSWNSGAGAGLDTGIALAASQSFTVAASSLDLWASGGPYRISNAAGLTGNLYSVAGDDSLTNVAFQTAMAAHGYAAPALGNQLGSDFGLLDGLAPHGSLVGRVGGGALFLIGLGGSFIADSAGTLNLFYWDGGTTDNFGSIQADVNPVPLPAAVWLLLSGLGGVGMMVRRRRAIASA